MTWDHSLSRHERGYGYAWTKLRASVMQRDRYLCQPCQRQGRTTIAKEVDHITPKAMDGDDDFDNLQAICTDCHKAKTKAEKTRKDMTGADGWPIV